MCQGTEWVTLEGDTLDALQLESEPIVTRCPKSVVSQRTAAAFTICSALPTTVLLPCGCCMQIIEYYQLDHAM